MSTKDEIWYFRYLDLPAIPEKFLDEAKEILRNQKKEMKDTYDIKPLTNKWVEKLDEDKKEISYSMFRPLKENGKILTSRSVVRFPVNEDFEFWIRENITDKFIDASIAPSYKQNEDDEILGPHTDTTRDYLLLYIFDISNKGQKTIWWQENGQPVVRGRNVSTNDFDNMTKLHEVEYKIGKWVIMNATILHSVHNIVGYRDAIQISLTEEIF